MLSRLHELFGIASRLASPPVTPMAPAVWPSSRRQAWRAPMRAVQTVSVVQNSWRAEMWGFAAGWCPAACPLGFAATAAADPGLLGLRGAIAPPPSGFYAILISAQHVQAVKAARCK